MMHKHRFTLHSLDGKYEHCLECGAVRQTEEEERPETPRCEGCEEGGCARCKKEGETEPEKYSIM